MAGTSKDRRATIRRGLAAVVAAAFAIGIAAGADAQERRYMQWRANDRAANALVEELKRIIERGEAERAADPLLFRDLREAIGRYESQSARPPERASQAAQPPQSTPPGRVTLLKDDFADGDYTRNPAWTVHQGTFWVEGRRGLRSRAVAERPEPPVVSKRSLSRPDQAISSGDRHPGLAKTLAFDGDAQTVWESALEGRAIEGSAYLGQDFGRGNARHIGHVFIQQGPQDRNGNAYTVDVQRWDAGDWQSVQRFTLAPDGSRQALELPRSAPSERWRVVATGVVVSAPKAHWQVVELEMEEIDQPRLIAKAPPPPSPPSEEKAEPAAGQALGALLGDKATLGQIGGAIVSELARRQAGGAPSPAPPAATPSPPPAPTFVQAYSAPLPPPKVPAPGRAEIATVQAIGNAFALRADLESVSGGGRLLIGPHQDAKRDDGYRLVYAPGDRPWLALVRLSSSGAQVVGQAGAALPGTGGGVQAIEWTRDGEGAMTVSVGGRQAFEVSDRGYRDPFAGLTVVNEGGDFYIGSVEVSGSR